jgi:putative transposase
MNYSYDQSIESTFATVRHRTTRTRNCVSRPTFPGLAFKLIEEAEEAEKAWRRINGPEQIKLLLEGIASKDGEPAIPMSAVLESLMCPAWVP